MRILQSASTATRSTLPAAQLRCQYLRLHRHHDNDTFLGWWRKAPAQECGVAGAYLNCDEAGAPWAAIHAVSRSVAKLAMFQLQDVLGLDSEHRMNTPGQGAVLDWRFTWDMVAPKPGRGWRASAPSLGGRR